MAAQSNLVEQVIQDIETELHEGVILDLTDRLNDIEALSEEELNEIDAWARHAMASSGFGDF